MNSSQRIVINTAATFSRSILCAGLSLFSSRWVLLALGEDDFGLFNVIGALIIFIIFINSVMATSASRHFAYAIGQDLPEEVSRWFNAAINIHILLAIALVLLGWPIGDYIITQHLVIPQDRLIASLSVFHLTLLSAFVGMLSIPYIGMFTAKQHIAELALWGILQAILTFILAFSLSYSSGDRLLLYATGMVSISIIILSLQVIRARYLFHECRLKWRYWFNKYRLQKIFSFAIWNLIGSLGAMLRNQGSAILLNFYFTPKVNAAYAIANQVSVQTSQLSTAMMGAFSPEITASEGRGDRERMLSMSLRVCKLGTILILLFAIPLIVEMEYVLKLWLKEPPTYTTTLCRLILCTFFIDRLTSGYMIAVNAHGRIAAYQATLGTSLLLTLPLAWCFLKSGFPPTSVGVAFIITMGICSLGRVFWVKHLLAVPIMHWVRNVFLPCLLVSATAFLGALLPFCFLPESFTRLVLTTISSVAASLLTSWFFVLDDWERAFTRQSIMKIRHKIVQFCTSNSKRLHR